MKLNFLFFLALSTIPCQATDPVFEEKRGVIVIEAESTDSRFGRWKKKTSVKGFTGECHIEFTGNKTENGPPESPLEYHFIVRKPGRYSLILRAHKRLETKRDDISNDCYVALKGDFESGGSATKSILRKDTKLFGGDKDGWGWAETLDVDHNKYPVIYTLKENETYELTISGRSKNFNIDRIMLVHESENIKEVKSKLPAESERYDPSDLGGIPELTKRTLTNTEGVSLEAELIGKSDGKVTVRIKGRRYELDLSTLSKDDRAFIRKWEP